MADDKFDILDIGPVVGTPIEQMLRRCQEKQERKEKLMALKREISQEERLIIIFVALLYEMRRSGVDPKEVLPEVELIERSEAHGQIGRDIVPILPIEQVNLDAKKALYDRARDAIKKIE